MDVTLIRGGRLVDPADDTVRAADLLVAFPVCDCSLALGPILHEELLGRGAVRIEDFDRLVAAEGVLSDGAERLTRPVTCPACGASIVPDEALIRILFTYAAARKADMVTVWDGVTSTRFVWSHQDGTVAVLDSRADMTPFVTASSFRLALGQVRFDEPEHPPALRSCLRQDPDFLPAVELTAQIRMAQGRYKDATALFRRVAREAPGRVASWLGLGLCLSEAFRRHPTSDNAELAEQAVRCLLEAEERSIAPEATIYRALGSVLLMSGHAEAARDQLEIALSMDENHSETIFHLGMARLRCHDPEQALGLLQHASVDRPDDPGPALWLTECLTDLGELERARQELARATALGAPHRRAEALAQRIALRGKKA